MAVRRCRKQAGQYEEHPGGETGQRHLRLCCARCGLELAHPAETIAIEDAVDHRCTNPAGITYDIRCYRAARLPTLDPPRSEHSWFAGYAWQIGDCPQCATHLGWRFSGEHQMADVS